MNTDPNYLDIVLYKLFKIKIKSQSETESLVDSMKVT